MPQIFVTIANGADAGRKLTVEVESADTVSVLKEKVEKAGGPCATLQHLSHDTVEMLSQPTLRDYKIQKESELKLVVLREHNKRADEQRSTSEEFARLTGTKSGLEDRWKMVAADAQALEEAKQALEQDNGGTEKVLALNVGGKIFKSVEREVLCLIPESHLAQLFTRWERLLLRDSKGHIFLDVHPECFAEILNFLRDRKLRPGGPVELPPVSEELQPTQLVPM